MTQKILIIGPAWVGDMVMAQTLFKLLKQKDPTQSIDVLAPEWTIALLSRMPEVNEAIEMPLKHGELNLSKRYHLAKNLRHQQYDQAIVLPNSFKSALIPWFAKIPKRTGWLGEARYFLLNDYRKLDKTYFPLMIDRFMALGLTKGESLNYSKEYYYPSLQPVFCSLEELITKHQLKITDRPILALAPGAAFGASKRWPAHYYAYVAQQKLKAGWDIWLMGAADDKPHVEKIMSLTENRCKNLAGCLDLGDTIDLLALTKGLITNDSGLMHVASALKKPLVAIYGSTSPKFTPPLSEHASILQLGLDCQPCFKRDCPFGHTRCLHELTPNLVLSAIARWTN